MCSGSENYNRNRKCRKCLHNGCGCVLTALLFYDILLSFMLTGCDGCIESDSKYRTGEEKPIERYKYKYLIRRFVV